MDIVSQSILSELLKTKLLLIFVEQLSFIVLGESELAVSVVRSINANFNLEGRSCCQRTAVIPSLADRRAGEDKMNKDALSATSSELCSLF